MEEQALRNLRFTISYDGTAYSGFQIQPKVRHDSVSVRTSCFYV